MAVYFSRRDSRLVLTCEHCGEVGRDLPTDADRRRFAVTHVTACRERPEQRKRERAALDLLPEIRQLLLPPCRDLQCPSPNCRIPRRIDALLEVNDG